MYVLPEEMPRGFHHDSLYRNIAMSPTTHARTRINPHVPFIYQSRYIVIELDPGTYHLVQHFDCRRTRNMLMIDVFVVEISNVCLGTDPSRLATVVHGDAKAGAI